MPGSPDPDAADADVVEADVADADVADADVVKSLRLLAVALCAVLVGTVVVLLTRDRDDGDDQAVATLPAEDGAVVAIGPGPGLAVADYVSGRERALAGLGEGKKLAAVSFVSYRTVDRATELLRGFETVEVVSWLVAAPGGEPTVVTGDLQPWVVRSLLEARALREELEGLLPTVEEGSEFIPFYASEIARLKGLEASLDAKGEVVFGLVVRAPARTLQRLALEGDVRLVDVGSSDVAGASSAYRGLRPEEVDHTGNPEFRPPAE